MDATGHGCETPGVWGAPGDDVGPRQPVRFNTQLPPSPLSYDGAIVKIRWCVRVRVFLRGGKQLLSEKPFQLGTVPAVRAVVS